jgi:mono/diheme cytochrome c family protein
LKRRSSVDKSQPVNGISKSAAGDTMKGAAAHRQMSAHGPGSRCSNARPQAQDTKKGSAMSQRLIPFFAFVAWILACSPVAVAQSRGELLYTTHCIACHTTQMHWRDGRAATDWSSLASQVRRWQGVASLGWSESDIQEVSRYLNETIYRFESGGRRIAGFFLSPSSSPAANAGRSGTFSPGSSARSSRCSPWSAVRTGGCPKSNGLAAHHC